MMQGLEKKFRVLYFLCHTAGYSGHDKILVIPMFSVLQARFYQRFTNISGESDLHLTKYQNEENVKNERIEEKRPIGRWRWVYKRYLGAEDE
ncbi:MAG: hypothetical protein PHE06_01655 [Lachnospiraceae bacterium]|nr:hypothetical protein [Lachnospiraceae bacterium]